jgi:hypothetical protein
MGKPFFTFRPKYVNFKIPLCLATMSLKGTKSYNVCNTFRCKSMVYYRLSSLSCPRQLSWNDPVVARALYINCAMLRYMIKDTRSSNKWICAVLSYTLRCKTGRGLGDVFLLMTLWIRLNSMCARWEKYSYECGELVE